MVDVHIPCVAQVVSIERSVPPSGFHPALPVGLEGHRVETLCDQNLLPGVLAVPVLIDPVLPVVPVVYSGMFAGMGAGMGATVITRVFAGA